MPVQTLRNTFTTSLILISMSWQVNACPDCNTLSTSLKSTENINWSVFFHYYINYPSHLVIVLVLEGYVAHLFAPIMLTTASNAKQKYCCYCTSVSWRSQGNGQWLEHIFVALYPTNSHQLFTVTNWQLTPFSTELLTTMLKQQKITTERNTRSQEARKLLARCHYAKMLPFMLQWKEKG